MRTNDDGAAIAFGQRILALLDTGSFTASYKYAVLLAVFDAVLEGTDERGRPPTVLYGRDIGRRVLELYWPQARPFTEDGPLAQSWQRDVVQKIGEFQVAHRVPSRRRLSACAGSTPMRSRFSNARSLRRSCGIRSRYCRGSASVGGRSSGRSSTRTAGAWRSARRPCIRTGSTIACSSSTTQAATSSLAGLLRPVIEREWLQFVAARNDADVEELRLQQFLFGSEHIGLVALVEPLHAVQDGRCFYCDESAGGGWEIDHFLPWARLPDNKLDNLVLAHARCNNDKRAALAGLDHFAR